MTEGEVPVVGESTVTVQQRGRVEGMSATGLAAAGSVDPIDSASNTTATADTREKDMALLEGALGDQQGTRVDTRLITDARLAACWPEASAALRRFLVRRGVSPTDVEDLVQECAVRVLAYGPTFLDGDDLLRWCLPVVRNLSVDAYRRGGRLVVIEELPERSVTEDLHEHVEHRVELTRVLKAITQLGPRDREAILAAVHDDDLQPANRREAVKLNVRRHRARQRLTAMLAGLLGVLGGLSRRTGTAAPIAPAALASFVVAATIGVGSSALHGIMGAERSPLALGSAADVSSALWTVGGASVAHAPVPTVRSGVPARERVDTSGRRVPSVTTPTGDQVTLSSSDTPPAPGALVCESGIPLIPARCVTRPDAAIARAVERGRPSGGGLSAQPSGATHLK